MKKDNWIVFYNNGVAWSISCNVDIGGSNEIWRYHSYHRSELTPVICHFLGAGNLESIFLVLRYLPNYDFSIFWTSSKCHRNHRTYFRMFPFAPQPPCRVATVPETLSSLMNCQIGSLGHWSPKSDWWLLLSSHRQCLNMHKDNKAQRLIFVGSTHF